jgi:hypothetical protein
MSIRVLPLLVLAIGCKPSGGLEGDTREAASELPAAPDPPHAIEILMAGKPPHEALRFVAGETDEQRVVVRRHYSKYSRQPAAAANTSDQLILIAQVGPGEHAGSFTGTIGTVLQEVDEFAPLARIEIGPRGPIGSVQSLRDEPHWLPDLLERLILTLPEEAVGEGAVWQTVAHDGLGPGHDLRVVYELLDVEHGVWHLKGESGLAFNTAPKPNPSPEREINGEFEVWWNPADPLPHRGRIKEQRTVYAPEGAGVELLELVLEPPGAPAPEPEGGW